MAIEMLPKWNLYSTKHSFYEGDSVTLIELASRLTGTMNALIDEYNKFAYLVNGQVSDFMSSTDKDHEEFATGLRQEFQDFIDTIDLKLSGITQTMKDLEGMGKAFSVDLRTLGLPNIDLSTGDPSEVEMNTDEIRANLKKGSPVQFIIGLEYLGMEFNTSVMGHCSEPSEGVYSFECAFSPIIGSQHWPMVVSVYVREGKIGAYATTLWNQSPSEGGVEYALPDYWNSYLNGKISTIKNLQKEGGRNCFSYLVLADMHYSQQNGHYRGKIVRRIMEECGIKFALNLGDVVSRGSIVDYEASEREFDGFWSTVDPIKDRLLCTQGNHDGYYYNGSSNYYPIEKALDRVYSGMKLENPIVWDDYGTGYFVDDHANRVRYIMLNTCSRGSLTGECPSGIPYMSIFRYTQCQFDLVKKALTTIPNDRWNVVVSSHVVPIWEVDRFGDGVKVTNLEDTFTDASHMLNLLSAFVNRSSVSISHVDETGEWANVELSVDFSDAKGTLISYNGGHYHVDKMWRPGETVNGDAVLACPVIMYRCDSFNENQGSASEIETALETERVSGTPTEHCFDVVTVDVDGQMIYCTRIGAGEDRTISMNLPKIYYTNLADPASEEWVENGRLSQSGSSVSTLDGGIVTNYIPCKSGDIIRIKGMNPLWGDVACTTNASAAWFADANKAKVGAIVLVSNIAEGALVRNDSDFDVEYTVGGYNSGATNNYLPSDMSVVAYMRFCGHITGSASDVIITVNEEII